MPDDTSLGRGLSQFPSTVWDTLGKGRGAGGTEADVNAVAQRYWRPVYRFIRSVWKKTIEDSKDLTQEFFASIFDREFLNAADPERGNFRQFVLASLRNFLADRQRAASALKRGGNRLVLSMDVDPDDDPVQIADPAARPEDAFDQAWAADILRRALERLESEYRASGKGVQFDAFRRHELSEGAAPSYREIARELGIGEFDVGNYLVAARRDLRRLCTEIVAETVDDPARVEEEMQSLFGHMA